MIFVRWQENLLLYYLPQFPYLSSTISSMPEQSRQLAAIMFTDIVGYTALMEEDEEGARVARRRHRRALEEALSAHDGRLIQYMGDG